MIFAGSKLFPIINLLIQFWEILDIFGKRLKLIFKTWSILLRGVFLANLFDILQTLYKTFIS